MARPGPAAGFEQITHPQKRAILRLYSQTMRLRASFEAAQVSLWMHYHWLKTDPAYKEAFAEARTMAAEALEEEAVRRGMGYEEPVYNETGDQIGVTHKQSDTLLIFLLKGAKPDVYKERYEHTGKDGGPLQVQQMAPDARQARLAALLAKRNGQAEPVTPAVGSTS